jgi:hypothetical protein
MLKILPQAYVEYSEDKILSRTPISGQLWMGTVLGQVAAVTDNIRAGGEG